MKIIIIALTKWVWFEWRGNAPRQTSSRRTQQATVPERGAGGMALAWFSQVIIAAERLTRAMRYALARRATCPGAKLSRACSGMLACGLCAIYCREAGVPFDHAGATRGVYPARCFHP